MIFFTLGDTLIMYGVRHLINLEERIFLRGNPVYVMKGIHFLRGNPKGIHQRGLILLKHNYSRGQHICKCIGTKESVCIRKEFNSHRIVLVHQNGRRFIVLEHKYGHRDVNVVFVSRNL